MPGAGVWLGWDLGLSHLIRAAAITAIAEHSEQITRDLLDVIIVDHAAESAAPKPPRPHGKCA